MYKSISHSNNELLPQSPTRLCAINQRESGHVIHTQLIRSHYSLQVRLWQELLAVFTGIQKPQAPAAGTTHILVPSDNHITPYIRIVWLYNYGWKPDTMTQQWVRGLEPHFLHHLSRDLCRTPDKIWGTSIPVSLHIPMRFELSKCYVCRMYQNTPWV